MMEKETLIGIISDTHGSLRAIERCVNAAGAVDMWLHLGDYASDATALRELSGKSVRTVRGNCDGGGCDTELTLDIAGARLLMMHGHRYNVETGLERALYRAEELQCSALLYGHTHVSHIEAFGRILIVNPGSPAWPRMGRRPSFALMSIIKGDVNARIVTLAP